MRAILSVYDKTGLVDFGRSLVDLGWELVASGGTARYLREAGLPVVEVADVTGAPEMLGGRVKTLHPAIHGGILARDVAADHADLQAQGIGLIDLVVCNLYPFSETIARPNVTLDEAIEEIDIGGVALLRAAAKNFARVAVVCDPADYREVIERLEIGDWETGKLRDWRRGLAVKAFRHTHDYDGAIAAFLERQGGRGAEEQGSGGAGNSGLGLPEQLGMSLVRVQALRYGENPHQAAALYAAAPNIGPLGGRLLQGKALSYNNLLDLDAAWRAAEAFEQPAVVIVKHLSPCGIAIGETAAAAFSPALNSDPLSAFGGVIAVNQTVDSAFVAALDVAALFVEAIIAPEFAADAQTWFAAKKKNCRLVALGDNARFVRVPAVEVRSIRAGLIAQTRDSGDPAAAVWNVVSQRPPSEREQAALRFAWIAVQHVKSNAIVLAAENATVGIGGGLSSRVDAVKLAAAKAGEKAQGAVMASDAFFPFPDGIEEAAAAGVTAVVEPGGSVRDDEVIAAADRLGVALVFTGSRHFRH